MKISFYAPIKPPDHPIPCGTRLISNNIIKSLELAQFDVKIASKFISYMKRPTNQLLEERKTSALREARLIVETWKKQDYRPDIFFTYHPYCKAPDWIGDYICRELSVPRVTFDAARTSWDNFDLHRQEAQKTIASADYHLHFKPQNKQYLRTFVKPSVTIEQLPPFIDNIDDIKKISPPNQKPLLCLAAMMRPGKKKENFSMAAKALELIKDKGWHLVVLGDGPELEEIQKMFSSIPKSLITWTGRLSREDVLAWMKISRAMIWPGFLEPIGMVYLEAAMASTPSIAFQSMGVPLVVTNNVSGYLVPEKNYREFANKIVYLIENKDVADKLGQQAREKQLTQHSLSSASIFFKKRLPQIAKGLFK